MTTSVKTCFKCRVEKPITDFYVHPQMGDGRLNKCKECTKKDVAKNYRDNIEYYREYERQRFTSPDRKKKVLKYQKRMREKNPEKYKARVLLTNAVRDGNVNKPNSCERCGATGRIEGHHEDYSRPMDVKWLCFKCHRAEHGQDAEWTPPAKAASG